MRYDDGLITFNVGGKEFTTSVQTLGKVGDPPLATDVLNGLGSLLELACRTKKYTFSGPLRPITRNIRPPWHDTLFVASRQLYVASPSSVAELSKDLLHSVGICSYAC